jgi:hypothetical protein
MKRVALDDPSQLGAWISSLVVGVPVRLDR